jgi:hypothetical protein
VNPAAVNPAAVVPPSGPSAEAVRTVEHAVRRFLSGFRVDGGHLGKLAASGNLWREVSSLTLLQLVTFLEQKFAITVRPIDFAPQNFSSITAIARFVAARQPAAEIAAAPAAAPVETPAER